MERLSVGCQIHVGFGPIIYKTSLYLMRLEWIPGVSAHQLKVDFSMERFSVECQVNVVFGSIIKHIAFI